MREAMVLAALTLMVATAAQAGDKPVVVVAPPGSGTTMARIGGETTALKQTANGLVGKIGKNSVLLHEDGNGNFVGKMGKTKLICHSDPRTGVAICK